MAGTGTAFDEFIAEEVKKYKGIYVPVKAGILRRAIIRKARLSRLHPNPDDEFCMPKVGPNYQIISEYIRSFRLERAHSKNYCVSKECVKTKSWCKSNRKVCAECHY